MSVETISKQLMAAMHFADQYSPAFIQTMELKCPFWKSTLAHHTRVLRLWA